MLYYYSRLNGDNTYVDSPATRALPAQGISLSFNNDLSDSAHPDKGSDSDDSLPRKRASAGKCCKYGFYKPIFSNIHV